MSRASNSSASCNSKAKPTNNGTIGFSDVQFATKHSKRDKASVQDSIKERRESNTIDADDSDSSCDSCSELTEQYNKRRTPGNAQVKTYRPAVRFHVGVVEMESSESASNKKDIEKDLGKLSRKGTGSVRYNQPRLSLLGKPINYRMHRRDMRYRRAQARIYNFLERPKAWYEFFYHIGM